MNIKEIIDELKDANTFGVFNEDDVEFFVKFVNNYDDRFTIENEDGFCLDKELINDLFLMTAKYKNSYATKVLVKGMMWMPQPDNKHITTADLEKRNKDRMLKVWIDLVRTGTTPKGRELMSMIDDFLEHPNDYFPKLPKITANIDEIRKFLQFIKLDLSAQKEYLEYFTISK